MIAYRATGAFWLLFMAVIAGGLAGCGSDEQSGNVDIDFQANAIRWTT